MNDASNSPRPLARLRAEGFATLRSVRLLRSALFWRILVSSLLVVAVLGWGLIRSTRNHEELEGQFERLVQHDLKLADNAEELLRLMADLETGKRGFLLTNDRSFLEPYAAARRDLVAKIEEAAEVAEPGVEDELIESFRRDVETWLTTVAEPQITGRASGAPSDQVLTEAGRAITDRIRTTLTRLREDAGAAAAKRERIAFDATTATRRSTTTIIALAIFIALATGLWIARDTAEAARRLQEGLAATGRLEPLPEFPPRRDELGEVGEALGAMAALLREKDGSLRATLVEREAALHELTEANEELRATSRALDEKGRELERANRVKTEFLAAMSHELRTPLSAILGFADLLLGSPKEQLSLRARESLERIKRNGAHLLSLINDVLDLAKAEAGRLDVRPSVVNVAALARACVAEVDSLRIGKDVQLSVEIPREVIEVSTDPQRLKQILLNLLSNAIKFTERGHVVLRLVLDAGELRLEVEDTGIGIAEHAIDELFRPFQQLDAGDGRRYEGTGMGLALSRRLARALGGDISVRSRQRAGSTFTITLPRPGLATVTQARATSEELRP